MRFVIDMKIFSILVQFQLCSSISSDVMLLQKAFFDGGLLLKLSGQVKQGI